jgi:hypothetical protein
MRPDSHALAEPRFWAAYLCTSFGQIGEPFDPVAVCDALGVAQDDARTWWKNFTGWYDGIFDESDGDLENPAGVAVEVSPHFLFEVETHPGHTGYFFRPLDNSHRVRVGEVGPHWRLPMLRWSEASRLSAHALILALPGVWVTPDRDECLRTVESAFGVLPLSAETSAATLTNQWIRAVGEGGAGYEWFEDPALGWVTSAHWSLRSREAAADGVDVRSANDALKAAGIA